jgi:hypothetical protein
MLEKKRLFDPGQTVTAFNGQFGMVMGRDMYNKAQKALSEGKKAGRFFAPGCCQHPDYITQVPVLFEDGTYDVMRSMNIKKKGEISEEKRFLIRGIIQKNELGD